MKAGRPSARRTTPRCTLPELACIISCAIGSKDEVDEILARAAAAGGSVPLAASEHDGGYMGYFSDPDGHLWELVANAQTAAAASSQS